ncbi:MAG: hypothetical protein FJ276_24260, partial [Planctomycetes bacterium]|nr:hypothetical protein [Planctomycetota bacterium]
MIKSPDKIASLRTLDRVQFLMAYLQAFCGPLLSRRTEASIARLREADSLRVCDRKTGLSDLVKAALKRRPDAETAAETQKYLRRFQQHVLSVLDIATSSLAPGEELGGASATGTLPPGFLDWAWRRAEKGLAENPFAGGDVSECGVRLVHGILLLEVGVLPPDGEDAEKIGELARSLTTSRIAPADMVTHAAAVLALGFCLARLTDRPLETLQPLYRLADPPWRDLFVPLISRNGYLLTYDPAIKAIADKYGDYTTAQPITLVQGVQRKLKQVRDFSDDLILRHPSVATRDAIAIGSEVQAESRKFAALWSPLDADPASTHFADKFAREMAECERKLFEATVTPRQSMFDNFIRWARLRFVMVDGVHLPLSEMCLSVMVHCHNLLALQRTENALASEKEEAARKTALKSRARLVESLKYTAARIAAWDPRVVAEHKPPGAGEAIAGEKPADDKGPARAAKSADPPKKCTASPMVGDLLMLYFAVEGLQRSFGMDFDKKNASWIEILPRLDGTVRRELMTLIAISPLNRLLCSELADEFAEEPSIPHLKTLLEDGRAEVLRSLVHTGLIRQVKPQDIRPAMRSVRRCLATETVGGVLVASEFCHAVLKTLFRKWEREIRSCAYLPTDQACETENQFAAEVRRKLLDFKNPAVEELHQLLTELLAQKCRLEKDAAALDSRRLNLIRSHWQSIAAFTTRGLRDYPWTPRGRRLLAAFWLLFCRYCHDRFADRPLPHGLETGLPGFDSFGKLDAWLSATLQRACESHRLKKGDASAGITSEETEELDQLASILKFALGNSRLRRALIAARLLVPGKEPGKPVWDPKRVDELAGS